MNDNKHQSQAYNADIKLREINRLKQKITFGNVPPFYHAVSTSLGLTEGMFRYGFENSLDLVIDQNNWNPVALGGKEEAFGAVKLEQTPRLSIYKVFTHRGFEIHCIPWLKNREIDRDMLNHPDMEFKRWIPASMKVLFRVAQLHTFIQSYFDVGDEADLELIKYAHNISEDFIDDLSKKLNVQKVHGISIKGFFAVMEKKHKAGEDFFLPKVYDFKD
ncbi:hypothetical protein [Aliiglaciecola sp. LCG003]|uniref:hypothetical protein n=1 Tax=Aliiglaciecola sp. LCG003 TaxID=3053655 RepID=UPI00257474E3|nr:hypothetical protein [Aliiglaciecola sp. LCG003]WJG10086.1 hypothetical protein QR722_03335 [Aliiglaciecola sp. LCG003]